MPGAKQPAPPPPNIADHPLFTSLQPQLRHNQPIATHLNADTSWLLLLPHPPSALAAHETTRPAYLKILIDPWFTGFSDDGAVFRTILYAEQHNVPSAVQTIAELEQVLDELEKYEGKLSRSGTEDGKGEDLDPAGGTGSLRSRRKSPIDVVVVSNDNGDHCHGPTLRQLDPSVPVVALPLPSKIIRAYGYFETVYVMREFDSCVAEDGAAPKRSLFGFLAGTRPTALDWRVATYPSLPGWLGLAYTTTPGEYPAFHTPLMVAFPAGEASDQVGRAIFYMPHGASTKALGPFRRAEPSITVLAVLTGLHRVWLTAGLLRIAGGASGALDLVKELRPKYWLATHDEVKETTAKGLIVPVLLRREEHGVEDTIEIAQQKGLKGRIVASGEESEEGDTTLLQPGSGVSCILGESQETAIRLQP